MGLFDFLRSKPTNAPDRLQVAQALEQQKKLHQLLSGMGMYDDGVDADELPNGIGEFGATSDNPIPCHTISGSTSYLERLRTTDGAKVTYRRQGSFGSKVSSHPVDGYDISHPDGRMLATIYISPYQKRISGKAPRGFTLSAF